MKLFLSALMCLFLFVACDDDTPPNPPTNTGNLLGPVEQQVIAGSVSDSSISTLGKYELTGTSDQYAKYIEYTPATKQMEVVYTYKVVASAVNSTTDFKLTINYRGSVASVDLWDFEVFRPLTGTWERVASNTTAQDWKWSLFSVNVGKMNTVFDGTGSAKVKVKAVTGNDAMNLDLLAFNYQGVIATPTPTPTPTPTATPTPSPTPTPVPGSWWKPTPGTKWDIQYANSTLVIKPEIIIYNIDLFDTEAATIANLKAQGKKVICYFSAGSSENWRPDFSQFPSSVKGKKVGDWAGENWLDVRQLSILQPIMSARIQMAKNKGCDAVDPDNVDGYTNDSGFALTYQHQLDYNKMLVNEAHTRGLAIGLKNNLNQILDLVSFYDFSVNESCFDYNECAMLSPFITQNKPVFGIQYNKSTSVFCPQAKALGMDFIKKTWDLDAWIDPCWNH